MADNITGKTVPTLNIQLQFEQNHVQFNDLVGCKLTLAYYNPTESISAVSMQPIHFRRNERGLLAAKFPMFSGELKQCENDRLVAMVSISGVDGELLQMVRREVAFSRRDLN